MRVDVRAAGRVGLVDRVDAPAEIRGLLVECGRLERGGPSVVLDAVEQDLEGGDLFGCGEAAVVGSLDEQLA